MPKNTTPINDAFTRLANSIADVISHSECPSDIYNDLADLTAEWNNRYDGPDRKREADAIRKQVPMWPRQAVEED